MPTGDQIAVSIVPRLSGRGGQLVFEAAKGAKSATGGDVWFTCRVRKPSAHSYALGDRLVVVKRGSIWWQGIIVKINSQIDFDEIWCDGDGKRLADMVAGGDSDLSVFYTDNTMTQGVDGWQQNFGTNRNKFDQKIDTVNGIYIALKQGTVYANGDSAGWKFGVLGSNRISYLEFEYTTNFPGGALFTFDAIDPISGSVIWAGTTASFATPLRVTATGSWSGVAFRLRCTGAITPGGSGGDYFAQISRITMTYASTVVTASNIASDIALKLSIYTAANTDTQGVIINDLTMIQPTTYPIVPANYKYKSYRDVLDNLATQGYDGLTYSQNVLQDLPYTYYRMDAAGLSAETDLGSGAHVGTYSGSGWNKSVPGLVSGDADTAVRFLGSGTLSSSQFTPSTGDHTWEYWIAPLANSSSGGLGCESDTTPAGGTVDDETGVTATGNISFMVFPGGTLDTTASQANYGVTVNVLTQPKNHIVCRVDTVNNLKSIWWNGKKVAENAGTASFAGFATPRWVIGHSTNFNYWLGVLDEAAYYKSALSDARIQAHWQSPPPLPVIYGLQSMGVGRHRLYMCVPGYLLGSDLSKLRYIIDRRDAEQIQFQSDISASASGVTVLYLDGNGYRQQTTPAYAPSGAQVKQKMAVVDLTSAGQLSLANAEKAGYLALADMQRITALGQIKLTQPCKDMLQGGRLCPVDEIEPGYLIGLPNTEAGQLAQSGLADIRDGQNIAMVESLEADIDGMSAVVTCDKALNRLDRFLAQFKAK